MKLPNAVSSPCPSVRANIISARRILPIRLPTPSVRKELNAVPVFVDLLTVASAFPEVQ